MPTLDSQVHAYERNRPGRPWSGTLTGPAEVIGDQMVAATDEVGLDGAILVSPFSMYRYYASYALEIYAAHPSRFRLVKPVDPTDPTNNVYRQHLCDAGLTDTIPPNGYPLFVFYNQQQSLTPPVTAPTNSLGVNFSYTRHIRPDLSGYASAGYLISTNSPSVVTPASTITFNTVTASLGLNYVFARNLTGSILTFSYNDNGAALISGRTGAYLSIGCSWF